MSKPLLSLEQIELLLSQKSISEQHPWSSADEPLIQWHLKAACAAVMRATGAKSRIEWDHYGSGYASFVDAWFYKDSPEFDPPLHVAGDEGHLGLVVLLSRLSPYFVFMEGAKYWNKTGGSSYLPSYDLLDRLRTPAVSNLARSVQGVLEAQGLVRAYREQLSHPLPAGVAVPTVLAERGFTQFDALFHWED